MTDFDAIVIGAGNSGLTAATALQRGGSRTLLLERHNIPGGCATSFVRGEFEFEVALHQLSGMGTEDKPFVLRQIFEKLGIMDRIEIVEEGELYRVVMQDQFDITLPASVQGINETLAEHFPEEADAVKRFMKLCEVISLETFMTLPRARKTNDEAMLKKMCPNFVKYGLVSVKEVLDDFFTNEDLKTVLAAYWCYLGLPPKDIPFSDIAIMIYAYAAFKPTHVKGGSQAISSALLESFQEAGGVAKFNCGAEKIFTENGSVTAVRTEHGDVFTCDSVVSNSSPIHTYNELLDFEQLPEQVAQDMKSRRIGTSAFVLYLGMDCSPEDLGITAASNFMLETRNEEEMHDKMQEIDTPVASMLTCYNFDDPSFAPPGKSALSLLCLQYGEPWENVPAEEYAQTKYKMADSLIDQAERYFPGIRDNIEELEVATPLTMMRYLNTPGGAIYGFQQNTQDGHLFRERLDAVDGLYMAGCWNGMGGFQPTYMIGESTARAILKRLSRKKAQAEEVEYA